MLCAQCKVCRAQWKHCYPKCIYHLVWLLRLLANTRKLELFHSDTALRPSVTTRIYNVWEFNVSTGGLFSVSAMRKICQLSPLFMVSITWLTQLNGPHQLFQNQMILLKKSGFYSIVGGSLYKAFRLFQSHTGLPLQWSIRVHHNRKQIFLSILEHVFCGHTVWLRTQIRIEQLSTILHVI